ncbi:DUF4168 domain-containing protein [Leptolyngbya sp. O-77]|uniref:DUF4168 domain-containing protein n=1 Tax=Leptolyngbya sp. O-77 TaxID=1080068 RepID=UPI00074D3389|nr:DUF4168 domain-containing protein [Leptolyngbya sp. O-77]BAU44645.1 hypothetical protein O77CONTIG1_04490 [Leptolyngbya sp. O-77]
MLRLGRRTGCQEQAGRRGRSLVALLLGCLVSLLLMGAAGNAAELAPQAGTPAPIDQPLPPTSLSAEDIATEKVHQFVQAYLKVLKLVESREGELQAAETQLESQRVQQEVELEALALIEAAGLTQREYLQLLGLANTDLEFRERMVAQLQEMMD